MTKLLVKSYRGKFGAFLISFFRAILYNEKNAYKNAKTASALDILFPNKIIPDKFSNPTLIAFLNAVWHCSTASEVCVVLNEAVINAEKRH
jgi:hypothetical protein